ncbi:ribosome biogenesis GTPase YlqF [Gudongella sp. DL1XJH-153]|uniref:ribosome biogenesis GTPase YlqF n=1 Tax=Gudongella sp. DL1XJH-153 TaxID=3409804 RepID=UPI003BB5A44C
MNINWYPGHMKKTRESIQKNLKMIDIVFELLDARIPYSSQNPVIESVVGNKPRIVILNKSDLADGYGNKIWQEYYSNRGNSSILLNSISGKGVDALVSEARRIMDEKRVNNARKGIINQPIRAMILGIPNVGKSTLINSLSGRKGARTGNRPGITKTNQWIKTKGGIELLDTPGILWPKFEEEQVGINLAFTGAIKDEILDTETLALRLIEKLMNVKPQAIIERYSIQLEEDASPLTVMETIAAKRGCLLRAGAFDYEKASRIILDEFRRGMMGRITLEYPKKGE